MSLGVLTTVIGGVGNIFAQAKAGKIAKAGNEAYVEGMEGILGEQKADIAGLLGQDAYRNYMDTAQAQSIINTTREQLRENAERIRGGIAASGGTTEAAVAGQTAMNRGYADTINRLAGHGTQYSQMAKQRLLSALMHQGQMEGAFARDKLGMSDRHADRLSKSGQQFQESMIGVGAAFNDDVETIANALGIGKKK
jgi:hypothetical protein